MECDLPVSQIMGLYNRMIRKFVSQFNSLLEEEVGSRVELAPPTAATMEPVQQTLEEDLVSDGC